MKYVLLPILALTLGACMGPSWQQAGKSGRDLKADLKRCERDAEDLALAESGTTRSEYGMATRGPNANLDPRGLSPLQLKDQSELSSRYDRSVERCMKSKGYTQG
jgi:hypothetical protein